MDNLALNAMLARKAGMSYGQWKALQPIAKFERTPDARERVCLFCGRTFIPKPRGAQKYCDIYCQRRAAEQRAKERGK